MGQPTEPRPGVEVYVRDATLTLNGYQACTADTAIYPGKGTSLGGSGDNR